MRVSLRIYPIVPLHVLCDANDAEQRVQHLDRLWCHVHSGSLLELVGHVRNYLYLPLDVRVRLWIFVRVWIFVRMCMRVCLLGGK